MQDDDGGQELVEQVYISAIAMARSGDLPVPATQGCSRNMFSDDQDTG